MNGPEQAWRDFVQGKLALLTPTLVAVLRRLVEQPYPSQVAAVDFELFPDGFTDGFPARAFFMDARNSETFVQAGGRSRYPGTVDPALLFIDGVYTQDEEDAFASGEVDGTWEDRAMDISSAVFMDWFEQCWREAGGAAFPLRSAIMIHDDYGSERVLAGG